MNHLICYYCHRDGKYSKATVTVHDQRGCLHVCWEHALWRSTTSGIEGHSKDCPYSLEK